MGKTSNYMETSWPYSSGTPCVFTYPKYFVFTNPKYSVLTHPKYYVLTHPKYYVLTHPKYSVLTHPKYSMLSLWNQTIAQTSVNTLSCLIFISARSD